MHEKRVQARYNKEILFSLMAYGLLLCGSIPLARSVNHGWLQDLIVAAPMVGALCMVWAVIRHLRRLDEYQRLIILENIAIAAGVTAVATLTYGFLEGVGFPRLSMFAVWPLMGATWFVLSLARNAWDGWDCRK